MKIRITPVDDSAAQDGTWTDYRGVSLKIARAGNERFSRSFMNASRPHRKDIERNALDNGTAEKILCEALAEGILVDWKNFVIDGEELQYSKANASELMKQDPDCREFVQEFARDLNNFIVADKEEVAAKL